MNTMDLSGTWTCAIPGRQGDIRLPGTLDENGFGEADDPRGQWKAEEIRRLGFWKEGDPIITRLTRRRVFEGQARFSRRIRWKVPAGKRVFLECERARLLRLIVNGQEVPAAEPGCLSAPWVFEVTGLVSGDDELVLLSDNSYPGWPRDAIVYASAASDETQTNWNGILGYIRLRIEEADSVAAVRVFPGSGFAEIRLELHLSHDWEGEIRIRSAALLRDETIRVREKAGTAEVKYRAALKADVRRWDLEEGNLYTLAVTAKGLEGRTVSFGVREFAAREGHLVLNGRRIFLRGETNCAVFPETGYIPMDRETWKEVLRRYRAYGVNFIRFHSHCPPEAAFEAADEAGMLLQPECSHWDPEHAFATEESRGYYAAEAHRILRSFSNHPSFVMLTLGNELRFDGEGRQFADGLLHALREADSTRLYADGSNPFYGEKGPDPASDFYTASDDRGRMLRATSAGFQGWLNRVPAGAPQDYSAEMGILRGCSAHPVFSFETGQYEVLPDFGQIADYTGVTVPENLIRMEKRMLAAGLGNEWGKRVEASGENALQCYRAEAEAVMRTEEMSGICLLGLQDFPGQGTALVGMMDAHLKPKPYGFARPERFAAFFRDVLPLALLPGYVFTIGEEVRVPIRIANYGKTGCSGRIRWCLAGNGEELCGESREIRVPTGTLSTAEEAVLRLNRWREAARLTLTIRFDGNDNEYPLWVYPDEKPACPPGVLECRELDGKALDTLAAGGRVYLAPDSTEEALPCSVQAQFSPDFWSVCTFPFQPGCMGQLIDAGHPLFRHFPTETFSSWQWQPMASRRAIILPRPMKAIIAEMDSCATLRPLAKMFECRCGGGKLLVSSMGLHQLCQTPNVRALQNAVYRYLASDLFNPQQEITPEAAAGFLQFRSSGA